MSYTIETNRVFLKSAHGYTPCILTADSSISPRRSSWGIWKNLLGVSETTLREEASEALVNQWSWMKKGKWVEGKGLVSWVESGMKRAISLEQILEANRLNNVLCYLLCYEQERFVKKLECYCSNTDELDHWIDSVIHYGKHPDTWSVIDFWLKEDLRQPVRIDGAVILKSGTSYVAKIRFDDDSGYVCEVDYTRDIMNAMVFDSVAKVPRLDAFGKFRIIKASAKEKPNNVALLISEGVSAGRFISEIKRHKLFHSSCKQDAKRYADGIAAEKAAANIYKKFGILCKLTSIHG